MHMHVLYTLHIFSKVNFRWNRIAKIYITSEKCTTIKEYKKKTTKCFVCKKPSRWYGEQLLDK